MNRYVMRAREMFSPDLFICLFAAVFYHIHMVRYRISRMIGEHFHDINSRICWIIYYLCSFSRFSNILLRFRLSTRIYLKRLTAKCYRIFFFKLLSWKFCLQFPLYLIICSLMFQTFNIMMECEHVQYPWSLKGVNIMNI